MKRQAIEDLQHGLFFLFLVGTIVVITWFVIADLDETDQYSFLYDMTHRDRVDMIVMGEHYGAVATYWKAEVERRYSDAVMILAHGGPDEETGVWIVQDDMQHKTLPVEEAVANVRKRFPYRRIVMITCNGGHQYLRARFVSYALEKVWFWPDNIMYMPMNEIRNTNEVGNIFDFVENP